MEGLEHHHPHPEHLKQQQRPAYSSLVEAGPGGAAMTDDGGDTLRSSSAMGNIMETETNCNKTVISNTSTNTTASVSYHRGGGGSGEDESEVYDDDDDDDSVYLTFGSRNGGTSYGRVKLPSLRRLALFFSLYVNIAITIAKLVAYLQSYSLSVLAALLDSVLDILSQLVLNYTEKHSSMQQRSSALYPAGASRLEPIGVLTCAALMGMASFEVLKQATTSLISFSSPLAEELTMSSFYSMLTIIAVKLALLWLCNRGANKRVVYQRVGVSAAETVECAVSSEDEEDDDHNNNVDSSRGAAGDDAQVEEDGIMRDQPTSRQGCCLSSSSSAALAAPVASKAVVQLADPTMEALAQDHFNDVLSNAVAAGALLIALAQPHLWFLDPVGAILISLYIIYSWYQTGREQIEQLTGKSAPDDLIDELKELAQNLDERILEVDVVRAYHFGPKFLVEIEIVMPETTLLYESHDVGMELQYEIESREEVERCFVHIDYQQRPYDEHVVSKVPELREKYRPKKIAAAARSVQSM